MKTETPQQRRAKYGNPSAYSKHQYIIQMNTWMTMSINLRRITRIDKKTIDCIILPMIYINKPWINENEKRDMSMALNIKNEDSLRIAYDSLCARNMVVECGKCTLCSKLMKMIDEETARTSLKRLRATKIAKQQKKRRKQTRTDPNCQTILRWLKPVKHVKF